jgi:large subunit ribosomal protein L24e
MVEKRNCSFCGQAIEPGTGKMYIKKDGTVFNFCSNKCKKNNIGLGRVSRRTRWTTRYGELKASTLSREKGPEEEPVEEKKPAAKAPAKPKKAPAKKPAAPKKEKSE